MGETSLVQLQGLLEKVYEELRARPLAGTPESYTRKGAAKALSVSVATVDRMIEAGELCVVYFRRRPVVPATEVRRLLTPAKAATPRGRRAPPKAPSPALNPRDAIRALNRRR